MEKGTDGSADLPVSAYGERELIKHHDNSGVDTERYRYIASRLPAAARLLEVGCFVGYTCRHFKELGHEVVGADISPYVIAEGRKLHPDLDLRCLDACAIDREFGPASFDAVVASEVIEHILDPGHFLLAVRRVLKPGGKLLLTTQNSNGVQFRLRMLLGRFRWDPTHLRLYSLPELKDELTRAGFSLQHHRGISINSRGPHRLARWLVRVATDLNPNFCWTWGVEASPKDQPRDPRSF
ncbi:MAG: class I SAM-dependent methyltransferase [Planctomycetes bacterium]|nr:class I SAM-dependent methyltransferase [Planctomycetota bacterium]